MTPSSGAPGTSPGRYEMCETPRGAEYTAPTGRGVVITRVVAGGPAGALVVLGYSDEPVADPATPPAGAVELWDATLPAAARPTPYGVRLAVPGGKRLWSRTTEGAWAMPISGFEPAA